MAESELFKAVRAALPASASWRPADTPMARLPVTEKRLRLGAEPPPGDVGWAAREQRARIAHLAGASPRAAALPRKIDWRDVAGKSYVTEVKNQRNCGSCVAFGAIAAVESALRVKKKEPDLAVDLSEAHLFYCHAAAEGRTCSNGWWPDRSLEAFRDAGVVDEACFPYTPGDQGCALCNDWQGRVTRIAGWQSLTAVADMKQHLAEKGPLIGCFVVYEDFYTYASGVYRHVHGDRLGGHCICIVGYDDDAQCWIAKNSWGAEWGEQGLFRIGYGEVGIDYEMWGVDVKVDTEQEGWLEQVLVTGIWVVDDDPSAAAYVDGVGWRRIPGGNQAFFGGLVAALSDAKAARSRCNLRVEGDVIREVYVF